MTWTAAREAVRSAIVALTGLEDGADNYRQVEWADRATANRWLTDDAEGVGRWVDLRISNKSGVGRGETRYEYDEDADTYTPVRVKWQTFTCSILFGSESQEPDENAMDAASMVETGIMFPEIRDLLTAGGVSVATVFAIQDASEIDRDSRVLSQAVLDIVFNAVQEVRLPALASGDYFSSVGMTGELQAKPNGDPVEVEIEVVPA
jgi:hypothetical protein